MRHTDYAWMIDLVGRNNRGAKWVRLHKAGAERVTIRLRYADASDSDQQVTDREAYLSQMHDDIWTARLVRIDTDGEIYEVVFKVPRQMSFDDISMCVMCGKEGGIMRNDGKHYCPQCWSVWNS
jgi:hypothetical protein